MPPLISQFDSIIFHFDGNNNDPDDIAALPITAAIAKSANIQDKITFFYGNNISELSHADKVAAMRQSAAFANKLGIKTYSYQDGVEKTTEQLVKMLNSGQKILSLEGGPMEAIYRALERVSPDKRGNITLVSHSSWNEDRQAGTRPGGGKPRTWSDIRANFPEVTQIDIPDQNGGKQWGFNNPAWVWLDGATNPVLKEARSLMRNAGVKVNDPSDAGMLYYALTGQTDGDALDAKAFFEKNPPSFSGAPIVPPKPTPLPAPDPITPPTPSPGEPRLKLSLVNAQSDQVVKGYEDLAARSTIDLKGLNLKEYSVVAQVEGTGANSAVKSIKFESNWGSQIENVKPYALFGDFGGDFQGRTPQKGEFKLKASAYSQAGGNGQSLAQTSLTYKFIDSSTAAPTPKPMPTPAPSPQPFPQPVPIVSSPEVAPKLITFALVNAQTNQGVKGYEDLGATGQISLNGLNLSQYSVIAQINPKHPAAKQVESVQFKSPSGDRTENVAPYALFGDVGGNYSGQSTKAGQFALEAIAYSKDGAQGAVLGREKIVYGFGGSTAPTAVKTAVKSAVLLEDSAPVTSAALTSDPTPQRLSPAVSRDLLASGQLLQQVGVPTQGNQPDAASGVLPRAVLQGATSNQERADDSLESVFDDHETLLMQSEDAMDMGVAGADAPLIEPMGSGFNPSGFEEGVPALGQGQSQKVPYREGLEGSDCHRMQADPVLVAAQPSPL